MILLPFLPLVAWGITLCHCRLPRVPMAAERGGWAWKAGCCPFHLALPGDPDCPDCAAGGYDGRGFSDTDRPHQGRNICYPTSACQCWSVAPYRNASAKALEFRFHRLDRIASKSGSKDHDPRSRGPRCFRRICPHCAAVRALHSGNGGFACQCFRLRDGYAFADQPSAW